MTKMSEGTIPIFSSSEYLTIGRLRSRAFGWKWPRGLPRFGGSAVYICRDETGCHTDPPPIGGPRHDNTVTWLANWTEGQVVARAAPHHRHTLEIDCSSLRLRPTGRLAWEGVRPLGRRRGAEPPPPRIFRAWNRRKGAGKGSGTPRNPSPSYTTLPEGSFPGHRWSIPYESVFQSSQTFPIDLRGPSPRSLLPPPPALLSRSAGAWAQREREREVRDAGGVEHGEGEVGPPEVREGPHPRGDRRLHPHQLPQGLEEPRPAPRSPPDISRIGRRCRSDC